MVKQECSLSNLYAYSIFRVLADALTFYLIVSHHLFHVLGALCSPHLEKWCNLALSWDSVYFINL